MISAERIANGWRDVCQMLTNAIASSRAASIDCIYSVFHSETSIHVATFLVRWRYSTKCFNHWKFLLCEMQHYCTQCDFFLSAKTVALVFRITLRIRSAENRY